MPSIAAPVRSGQLSAPDKSLRGTVVVAYGGTVLTLAANLVTGALLARGLDPAGRGALSALLVFPQMLGWLWALGSDEATTYFTARWRRAAEVWWTWQALLVAPALLGTAAALALIPVLFAAQTAQVQRLAIVASFFVIVVISWESSVGVLLGQGKLLQAVGLRTALPLTLLVVHAGQFILDSLSLISAAAAAGIVHVVFAAIAWILVRLGVGCSPPTRAAAKVMLRFGLRGQFASMGRVLNSRLDLLVIPAFLSSSEVGLYAVATSVSWVVFKLSASVGDVLLPRVVQHGLRALPRALVAMTAVTLPVTSALWAFCETALRIVYGPAFADSAESLRILLPGAFCYGVAHVLLKGVYGLGKPFTAAVCQLVGVAVALIGMLIALPAGAGIEVVAALSSTSYLCVLLTATLALIHLSRRNAQQPTKIADQSSSEGAVTS